MGTNILTACLIYEGPIDRIQSVISDYYRKFLTSGVRNLVLIIVSNSGLKELLPRLRDTLLNNVALGVKLYIFSYDEVGKFKSELERMFREGLINQVYVYSRSSPSLFPEICVTASNFGVYCEVVR